MKPTKGISSLKCTQHLYGDIWVSHHYRDDDDITDELHKVYFVIFKGKDRYGFSLRLMNQTMTIYFIPEAIHNPGDLKDILRFNSIPDNFTPETAQEKLSFYLTFM